jgi:ABC-type nickel/cobalt efflux system permease component RcnA
MRSRIMMRRRALTAGLARLTLTALLAIGLWSLTPAAGWAQAAPTAEQAPPKAAWPATGAGNSAQRQAARPQSWLLDTQRTLQSRLAVAVREMKKGDGWLGALTLIGLSFLYGLFHAAGPGHGKAVISSYVVANRTTVRRGVILSFAASAAQAFSAIGLVTVLAIGMNAAGLQIRQTVAQFEIASAALVILTGLWLLFTQLRRQLTAFRAEIAAAHLHPAAAQHGHEEHHAHHHHDHAHGEDCGCGHAHMPLPQDFEGRWSLRHAAAVVFAVGIRPCTGAILILVFALTQGMFWAGVMATFAMALGTAIMVSALAILAVGSREAAARFAGNLWADRIYGAAGTLGAVLIVLFGSALLYGAIYFPAPF